jgi:hypothetical protein
MDSQSISRRRNKRTITREVVAEVGRWEEEAGDLRQEAEAEGFQQHHSTWSPDLVELEQHPDQEGRLAYSEAVRNQGILRSHSWRQEAGEGLPVAVAKVLRLGPHSCRPENRNRNRHHGFEPTEQQIHDPGRHSHREADHDHAAAREPHPKAAAGAAARAWCRYRAHRSHRVLLRYVEELRR